MKIFVWDQEAFHIVAVDGSYLVVDGSITNEVLESLLRKSLTSRYVVVNERLKKKEWFYKLGLLHRNPNDGPAVEFMLLDESHRFNEWWVYGNKCETKKEALKRWYFYH